MILTRLLFSPSLVYCPWYVKIRFPWILKIGQILQRISQDQWNSICNIIVIVKIPTATLERLFSVAMIFSNTAQKMKFSIKVTVTVAFTEEIRHGKLHFLFCERFKFRKADIIPDFVWFHVSLYWSKYLRYACFDFFLYILFWYLN